MNEAEAADKLTRAAYYLMGRTNIWYDKVPNEYGDPVPGPTHQAVHLLCRLASDIRAEKGKNDGR